MGLFSRSSASSQHKLEKKKSSRRLRKLGPPGIGANDRVDPDVPDVPQISALQAHNEKYRDIHGAIDKSKGERRDDTGLLHAMVVHDIDFSDFSITQSAYQEIRPPGERDIAGLSPDLWEMITDYLSVSDAASLAFSSKTLLRRLGLKPWDLLEDPLYYEDRIRFLIHMDYKLPNHLLCFPCGKYHRRTQCGQEMLKPPNIINPLFKCPNAMNSLCKPPRTRLTPGRKLPFTFAQLATRAARYGPRYGVTLESMARRWSKYGWSHTTKYHIHTNGHLMVRVVSSAFATGGMQPSAMRKLLFCGDDDYFPHFSVCGHWKDGELMNLCKCALTHIPTAKDEGGLMAVKTKVKENVGLAQRFNPNALVSLCKTCRPMRRCPNCPSEYLIEVRLMEDKATSSFKQSIVVSRWSDLGDGTSPLWGEWAACNGTMEGYDSFAAAGNRGISGTFEAAFTEDHVPGQRCLNLNPKGQKAGENDDKWF